MESEQELLKKALENGDNETIDKIMKNKLVSPADRVGKDGFTLFHWACCYGYYEALQRFLLSSVNVAECISVVEKHGWTPAHLCAIKGHKDCLQLLIENGADMTTRDHRGYTCGHCAAAHGNSYCLQYILNTGYNVNLRDHRQWTVVHHAAFHGRYEALQMLAKWGADLVAVDSSGNLPAHLSASEGHLDCLRLLVYYQHAPLTVLNSRNNLGATPKDLSIQFQKSECADFLFSAVKDAEKDNEQELEEYPAHYAARTGNLEVLSSLITEGQRGVNDKDSGGSAPTHAAAGSGNVRCLQWLMDHGADLSLKNKLKESPLDVAMKYGKSECVSVIKKGTGIKIENSDSLEEAQQKMEELQKVLAVARVTYQQLGGILEEEDEREREIKEITERHEAEISDLKDKLELEREKRELLEREADVLRLQLHQTNNTLLHYKSILSTNQQVCSDSTERKTGNSSLVKSNKQRKRIQSAAAHKRTGGAYFDLKS